MINNGRVQVVNEGFELIIIDFTKKKKMIFFSSFRSPSSNFGWMINAHFQAEVLPGHLERQSQFQVDDV